MCMIKRDLQLEAIEKNMNWDYSIEYCYENWNIAKDHSNSRIRLFTQCWYMMSYWEQLPHKQMGHTVSWFDTKIPCNYSRIGYIMDQLQEQEHILPHDEKYNCLSGYLMYIQPEFFIGKVYDDYDICCVEGLRRLKKGRQSNDSECRLVANIVLDNIGVPGDKLVKLFPGQSLVDEYFCSILSDRH